VSLSEIAEELEKQAVEVRSCKETLLPAVLKESTIPAEAETFQVKFEEFLEKGNRMLILFSVMLLKVELLCKKLFFLG